MNADDVLIHTDARGRTNLSKFSRNGRFLARQERDGTIILEPCRVVREVLDSVTDKQGNPK